MIGRELLLGKGVDVRRALFYFFIAYCVVTVLAAATTIIYGELYPMPQPEGAVVSPVKLPEFTATVPYHVLIMLLVWPVFAWMYFRKSRPENPHKEVIETLRLSL